MCVWGFVVCLFIFCFGLVTFLKVAILKNELSELSLNHYFIAVELQTEFFVSCFTFTYFGIAIIVCRLLLF